MKVLILEENMVLAKVIADKISNELNLETDISSTISDAKKYVEKNDYILAIVDIDLHEDKNKIIDIFSDASLPYITTTKFNDMKLYEQITENPIIAYILKDRAESIDYMIARIHRVLSNRSHDVLLIDSNENFKNELKSILSSQFLSVVVAKNAQDALKILRDKKDFSLVISLIIDVI